ncbi:small acid-soluble spore protein H (minor) [Salinibacillus kushneri]|uniref:Small, acid-soluble spore protein H n=1 Tax=Salinibacillus kushneri TaxID=237682 RepID=A0A1I0CLC5_9BACI|nr:H-type small acid-soluble spore protein [Salinibacillus kushneri]SET20422.1 small acid-soluble spore protein H (minor) [Salinibacillus kushneri]
MNRQRAQEIVEAKELINVTHNATPVYIQHVDEQSDMARIYPLDSPNEEENVPLKSLEEH